MGSNYGTNKITSSQQNPMLSRQLSVSNSYINQVFDCSND